MSLPTAIYSDLHASRAACRHQRPQRLATHLDRCFSAALHGPSHRATWLINGTGDKDEVVLVKREVVEEGTLFVFGSEKERTASAEQASEEKELESTSAGEEPQVEIVSAQATPEVSGEEAVAAEASENSSSDEDTQEEPAASSQAEPSQPAAESGSESHSPEALANLKVTELQDLCKKHDIRGYSKLRKAELVDLLASELQ